MGIFQVGFQMRNNVPSDQYLEEYDKGVAAREAEIRRPGRKIDVISNEEYDRRNQIKDLRTESQGLYIEALRRRNQAICYKAFLLLQDQYPPEDGIDDSVYKEVVLAVCKTVTKRFFLLHCHMMQDNAVCRPDGFKHFADAALGISMTEREAGSMMFLARRKWSPTESLASQVKQDLDEVNLFKPIATALASVPGYFDKETRRQLMFSVSMRFKGLQRDRQKPVEDYIKQAHQSLEGSGPQHCIIQPFTPEQKEALKHVFDNEKAIWAFEQFYEDRQWSKDPETLTDQMNMLSDIANNDSVQKTIAGTMLKEYTETNMVVEAAASLRNDAYGSDPLGSQEKGRKQHWQAQHKNAEKLKVPALKTGWALLDGGDRHTQYFGSFLESWMRQGLI
ncbi:hypothetical protein PG991_000405 [Apiospora marii]|uniref:Uncharacterized protein n=1 Tax=Apiospora marii TaxID=335849 RepID=A0ABR1T207_9PEZI